MLIFGYIIVKSKTIFIFLTLSEVCLENEETYENYLRITFECFDKLHAFFISNTFISNTRLKLSENQAKANQQPEAKHLLFENCSLSSPMLSFQK